VSAATPKVVLLSPADARRVPWKNGRGFTEELALWPLEASFERADYLWRISIAAVDAPGPFSPFPGFERVLTVTEGEGLRLAHGSAAPAARVRRLEPYRFSGDWPTTAELVRGPVRDFNVIARRSESGAGLRAEVEVLALGERRARESLTRGHAFLHVLAGQVTARATGEEQSFTLQASDSLWARQLAGGEELDVQGGSRESLVLLVRLEARAGGERSVSERES